jgi:hypothetical protein
MGLSDKKITNKYVEIFSELIRHEKIGNTPFWGGNRGFFELRGT